jgi:hypothetical protein
MPETSLHPNLLAYFPEDVQSKPEIREFVGVLASYALGHLITPGEATQLAMHAGDMLRRPANAEVPDL